MNQQKTISEIVTLWKADKKKYIKKSSYSAYTLLIENHLLPLFGSKHQLEEPEVKPSYFKN